MKVAQMGSWKVRSANQVFGNTSVFAARAFLGTMMQTYRYL